MAEGFGVKNRGIKKLRQRRIHLGILASHPIQYHSPWFRSLSQQMDVNVFYSYRQSSEGQADAGFGVAFDWDTPLLDGYNHRWLENAARRPGLSTFAGCDNPEIYDIVRTGRFDAFLVFGWNRKSSIQAFRACRQQRVPFIMRGDSHLLTHRSTLKSAAKFVPFRWFLPRIDAHLYVGQHNREYLKHYGVRDERLFFCPHFVDNDFFREASEHARTTGEDRKLRARLRIPSTAFVFSFAGKMIPRKRAADVIQSAIDLLNKPLGANVHVILAGDGPLRTELERLSGPRQDRIHFIGFLNQSEMPTFYAASDALVLPSNGEETWGLVVNEAAACGVPSIVSNQAGCSADLIASNFTGAVFTAGDISELTHSMAAVKRTCETRPGEVRAALAENAARYSIQSATLGLEEALKTVTRSKPVAA